MQPRTRPVRRTRALAAVLAVLAVSLLLAAAASASRAPGHAELVALRSAAVHSKLVPGPVRAGHFKLVGTRISTAGPYASTEIAPTGRYRTLLDAVSAIFQRGTRGWRLVSLGTAGVGCGHPRLPQAVRHDLHIACP